MLPRAPQPRHSTHRDKRCQYTKGLSADTLVLRKPHGEIPPSQRPMQQAFGHLSGHLILVLLNCGNWRIYMQCSSPESFASVDHAQPGEDHRSVLRTTLSKITPYNFAAAHSLDTPIN